MRKLKMVLACLLIAFSVVACGDDDDDNDNGNNTTADAGDVATGDADATDPDAGTCEPADEPTCCNLLTGETEPATCTDGDWSCPVGTDPLGVGDVCEAESDAGDTGDGDAEQDVGDDTGNGDDAGDTGDGDATD
jgi:hypothetical protein